MRAIVLINDKEVPHALDLPHHFCLPLLWSFSHRFEIVAISFPRPQRPRAPRAAGWRHLPPGAGTGCSLFALLVNLTKGW